MKLLIETNDRGEATAMLNDEIPVEVLEFNTTQSFIDFSTPVSREDRLCGQEIWIKLRRFV